MPSKKGVVVIFSIVAVLMIALITTGIILAVKSKNTTKSGDTTDTDETSTDITATQGDTNNQPPISGPIIPNPPVITPDNPVIPADPEIIIVAANTKDSVPFKVNMSESSVCVNMGGIPISQGTWKDCTLGLQLKNKTSTGIRIVPSTTVGTKDGYGVFGFQNSAGIETYKGALNTGQAKDGMYYAHYYFGSNFSIGKRNRLFPIAQTGAQSPYPFYIPISSTKPEDASPAWSYTYSGNSAITEAGCKSLGGTIAKMPVTTYDKLYLGDDVYCVFDIETI